MQVLDYALMEAVAIDNGTERGRLLVALARGYLEALNVGEFEARLSALEAIVTKGSA